jgi:hypothetical protein
MRVDSNFRSDAHLYPIRSHQDYGFYVGSDGVIQSIVGRSGNDIVRINFSSEGDLIDGPEVITSVTSLMDSAESYLTSTVPGQFGEVIGDWIASYCNRNKLDEEPIQVKRFAYPDLNIGIEDFPEHMAEFLRSSDTFSEEERNEMPGAIEYWKGEGQFVFWWGQSFWMDQTGEVTSS